MLGWFHLTYSFTVLSKTIASPGWVQACWLLLCGLCMTFSDVTDEGLKVTKEKSEVSLKDEAQNKCTPLCGAGEEHEKESSPPCCLTEMFCIFTFLLSLTHPRGVFLSSFLLLLW